MSRIFIQKSFKFDYVWVSHDEIISHGNAASSYTYDLKMTSNLPADVTIKTKETFGLVFTIISTNPMTNMEFEIAETNNEVIIRV